MNTKAIISAFLAATVTVAGTAAARAEVIVDNLNQGTLQYFGPIGDASNDNNFLIGQEFSLPAGATPFQLNSVTLLLSTTGASAHLTVSIWNVNHRNNPSNQVAMVSSQLVSGAGAVTFIPSTNILLGPGIYYVVASPTTSTDSDIVSWAFATTTNWTGSGAFESIGDTMPGAWENHSVTNLPQQMEVVATPASATLTLSRHGTNDVVSWPAALNGFVVESTTNLAPAAWQALTNTPSLASGTNTLTNSISGPSRFFRLRQTYAVENLDQPQINWDGPIGNDDDENDFTIGQQFTLPPGAWSVSQVTLPLIPANGQAHITVSLWNTAPDNTPSNEVAVVSSQLVSQTGNVTFTPASSITLSGGTYYVVAAPTSPADNAKIGWYWTSSTSWTGFGALNGYAATYFGYWDYVSLGVGPYEMSVLAQPVSP